MSVPRTPGALRIAVLAIGGVLLLGTSCEKERCGNVFPGSPALYATFDTELGTFVVELYPDSAPATVANFVGLATGTKEWRDPGTGEWRKTLFYNGLLFHRVIAGFLLQGGDPAGTGRGGPGYVFEDEFVPGLRFDRPGRLAMANAGPGTNGSQFFITLAPATWLDDHHTIFGQVVDGQIVVERVSRVPVDRGDRPIAPVRMNVRIDDCRE